MSSPSSAPASSPLPSSAASSLAGTAALSLYVHWPFCLSKCPYCDFNSHEGAPLAGPEAVAFQDGWRDAYLRELETLAARLGPRHLVSLFFGGGTPSLMEPTTVAALIDRARALFPPLGDFEITLEANPGAAEGARLAAFVAAGVNRLSLGIQSFDDRALSALGRRHTSAEAIAVWERGAALFPRASFDLIYGRPGQTARAWRRELDQALDLCRGHLSLYQLTVEPGTPLFAARQQGSFTPLAEEATADLFEITQERLAAAGLPAYEISNHARPGHECRHNLVYWRYGDYLGLGPGAHGRLTIPGDHAPGAPAAKAAWRQIRDPAAWRRAVARQGHGLAECRPLPARERALEALMMGLRLAEGIDRRRFQAATGLPLEAAVDPGGVERLLAGGFLETSAAGLRASAAGRQRLAAVLEHVLPDRVPEDLGAA